MAVSQIESVAVEPYEDGVSFGDVGPYEVVRAVLRYAVDPETDAGRRIVDLDRARRDASGLVDHAERLIEVEWDNDQQGTFVVSVEVEALDRSRLLRDISQVLAEYHVNIMSCTSQTSSDRVAKFRFDFELADPSHLDTILSALKRVDSVYAAYRVLPGHARANA